MVDFWLLEARRRENYKSLIWGAHLINPDNCGKVHDIEKIMYGEKEIEIQRYETPEGEKKTIVREPNLHSYEKNEIQKLLPGEYLSFW